MCQVIFFFSKMCHLFPFFLERCHVECDTSRVGGSVNGSGALHRCHQIRRNFSREAFFFLGARWHIECDTARVEGGVNGRGGGLGSSTIFKNLMSPMPRRKWYLTTGRRAH